MDGFPFNGDGVYRQSQHGWLRIYIFSFLLTKLRRYRSNSNTKQ